MPSVGDIGTDAVVVGPIAGEGGPGRAWDLLVLSDIHLGSDLRRSILRRRGGVEGLRQDDNLDRALGTVLDHYAAHPPEGRRWRLVLAGDVVDFIAINATPADLSEAVTFQLSADEVQYGLEPGPERCAWMMGLVARRHPHFFRKLAAFLARGHDAVVVRGNHDAALLWPEAQKAFIDAILTAADTLSLDVAQRQHLSGAVLFEDWFYLEPGRIYVEHGHLYDSYCSEPNARRVEPQRPDRLAQPVSTLMLRYFGNRFPSMDLDNVDQWTLLDFARWGLIVENPIVVLGAWIKTIMLLLLPFWRRYLRRIRRWRATGRRAQIGASAEDEITDEIEIASRVRARLFYGAAEAERLAMGLAKLVKRAATVGAFNILQIFYLDRLLAMGLGVGIGVGCLALPFSWLERGLCAVSAIALAFGAERWFATIRRVSIAPKLHAAAEHLSTLISVPLVVMGHSHHAVDAVLGDGRTRYVNLGSWGSASQTTSLADARCPHLLIQGTRAQFLSLRVSDLAPELAPAVGVTPAVPRPVTVPA